MLTKDLTINYFIATVLTEHATSLTIGRFRPQSYLFRSKPNSRERTKGTQKEF